MADTEQREHEGPDMAAIVHAIEDEPHPEVAAERIAQAVAAPSSGSKRKGKSQAATVRTVAAEPAPAIPSSAVAEPAPQPLQISTQSEEPTMADETINDTATQTNPAGDFAATMQGKLQSYYERTSGAASEMTDLTRGNMEAVVESGRILAAGMQDIGRSALEETRAAFDTMTADVKRMAAVTSPTELMQLQGEVARRNVDAFITHSSKNAEAMLKLVNDMFAPVSSRMSVAAEKLSKAA